ncbi:hypothetical protein KC799_06670 [candidate division KSB1 bacterium]|nr:hypothetical protein [candidate division KSB1 bacterium]
MRKINLQTIVSIAEIITALAVVVSLIYAANEFRRSQDLTSTDVQTIVYERMLQMDVLVIENKDIADIRIKAAKTPEKLTAADSSRFLAYEHIFYDSWELAWTAFNEGILKEGAWKDWNSWFVAEAKRRPALGWIGNRKNHGKEFVQYVEANTK